MGRLLAMLSSAINTELPSRLREIVREELAQASGAIAAAAVLPVVAAVQAALPKVRPGGTWQRAFSRPRAAHTSLCCGITGVPSLCARPHDVPPTRTMYRPPAQCTARSTEGQLAALTAAALASTPIPLPPLTCPPHVLPEQEVSSAVRASLDKALPTAVASALAKPAQEAFRTAFSKTLVPAFEGACQSMFVQLNGALAQGLEEHTQASTSGVLPGCVWGGLGWAGLGGGRACRAGCARRQGRNAGCQLAGRPGCRPWLQWRSAT